MSAVCRSSKLKKGAFERLFHTFYLGAQLASLKHIWLFKFSFTVLVLLPFREAIYPVRHSLLLPQFGSRNRLSW